MRYAEYMARTESSSSYLLMLAHLANAYKLGLPRNRAEDRARGNTGRGKWRRQRPAPVDPRG